MNPCQQGHSAAVLRPGTPSPSAQTIFTPSTSHRHHRARIVSPLSAEGIEAQRRCDPTSDSVSRLVPYGDCCVLPRHYGRRYLRRCCGRIETVRATFIVLNRDSLDWLFVFSVSDRLRSPDNVTVVRNRRTPGCASFRLVLGDG